MPNIINKYSSEIDMVNENFQQLIELPDTKPLVIVDSSCKIRYANKSFSSIFALYYDDEINKLRSEPSLELIISNLIGSSYRNFLFDLFYQKNEFELANSYYVSVDRLLIENDELFLFVFDSYKTKNRIEGKINNLHNALEYGDVAVLITDEMGKINYSSKAFEEILGTGIENIFNKNLGFMLKSYLNSNELDELNKAIINENEWTKLLTSKNNIGVESHREIKLNPVKRNEAGSTHFILVAHDITNYVLKNRIVEQSEQRQKSIINNISDPLIIVRGEEEALIFERANESFYSSFNIPKCENDTSHLDEVVSGELYDNLYQAIRSCWESENFNIKFDFSDKENEKEYIGKLTYIENSFDNSSLYIINFSDITEQLKAQKNLQIAYEKEIKLNKLKSAFLANMSHEIRTPLNAIIGYSDILEDDVEYKDYDSLAENTANLKDGVKRLLVLVENIIEASVIESGDLELDAYEFDINLAAQEIYEYTISNNVDSKLSFSLDLSEEKIRCFLDKGKLEKILKMIVENAIKYNKKDGSVLINTFKNYNNAVIQISDTGIGIENEKLKTILEPFIQEEEEGYKRRFEGAGLGLTIAYKLTTAMNGKFLITSKVGQGTTVILEFPLI